MNYIYIDTIESTQTYLKEHIDSLPHETWLCAGYQSKGKGQFERTWQSESNVNILCSLLLKNLDIQSITNIQYKVSTFMMNVLKQYNIETEFKEPNDIYYKKKKLCGILVDTKIKDHICDVIIGIGLNVNQTHFNHDLNATSMALIKGNQFNLDDIKEHLIKLTSHIFI